MIIKKTVTSKQYAYTGVNIFNGYFPVKTGNNEKIVAPSSAAGLGRNLDNCLAIGTDVDAIIVPPTDPLKLSSAAAKPIPK
jgi:hypothetical protein